VVPSSLLITELPICSHQTMSALPNYDRESGFSQKAMSALHPKADTHRWGQRRQFTKKLSELMLADKPRLGVGLGVINFFPRAVHKRPSAGVTDDCRHAAVVAIVRFVHFRSKLEGVGSLFSGYRHSKRKQRLSLIFVPISRFARFISITIKQFNVIG
jgi:hypothetical protein